MKNVKYEVINKNNMTLHSTDRQSEHNDITCIINSMNLANMRHCLGKEAVRVAGSLCSGGMSLFLL